MIPRGRSEAREENPRTPHIHNFRFVPALPTQYSFRQWGAYFFNKTGFRINFR
jgi:hypothetical protein